MTKKQRKATASYENLLRIFSTPESDDSTLHQLEKDISRNIDGFLREIIISGDLSPQDLENTFSESRIPEDPVFVSEQVDFLLQKVVSQSVHTSAPSFVGHMTSAFPYFMLPLAKIMMALNQNLVKIETSKAFTPLERQVIAMLHRLVYDFDTAFYQQYAQDRYDSIGVFCSGGTIANITALWAARNRKFAPTGDFAGIQRAGLAASLDSFGLKGIAVLVSKRGHYSLQKAADLLGIGEKHLVAIATTAENKIDIQALEREIAQLKAANIGILALVGIGGTTETGNVDPLDALADVARKEGCHFHVDAAWGGPTLFSKQHRGLLKGIERADSVGMDAHKQLYIPVGAGIVLFKDPQTLKAVEHHAQYIIREGSRDLGKHTLEGSRSGIAMLVHSGLKIIGRKGYGMLIEQGIEKAKVFAQMIEDADDFELITKPELNLLTYRFVPERLKPKTLTSTVAADFLNSLTIQIQKVQRDRGKTFVSRTTLQPLKYEGAETVVFRAVLANPLSDQKVLQNILREQRDIANELLKGEFKERFEQACL